MLDIALLMAFFLCAIDISGVLIRMLQNIKLYSIMTSDKQRMIQIGTKMISHDQPKNPSSFKGINTNCRAFTDKKSSSSKLLSFCCLMAQMQKNTLTIEDTINGIKTRIQRCLFSLDNRSTRRNSNIRRIKCRERLISIDLN